MAISRLATSNPAANTDILIYTAPRTILSSIIATNKSSTPATIRAWVVPLDQDAVPANHSFVCYNTPVGGNDSLETFRFALMTGDKVYIRASATDMSFNLSGIDDTNIPGTELADLEADIAFATNIALLDI
jgi:hypothetical protein